MVGALKRRLKRDNPMKSLAALVICAIPLAGCMATLDQYIKATLPAACAARGIAYTGVMSYAAKGKLKPSVVTKVEKAKEVLDAICVDAANATTETVLIRATAQAAIIYRAYEEAKANDD
jgi:hypothetical protein